MLISEFLSLLHGYFSFVSVFSLVFWPLWPVVLVNCKSSGLVGCLCWDFGSLCDLWGPGVLGTSKTSGRAGGFHQCCGLGYGGRMEDGVAVGGRLGGL